MRPIIPYGRQNISESDVASVIEVLQSDYLTQGPAVPRFERAVASYSGVKHAVAVNSATSALHIACLALGVGKGDLVWTSPITFVASANCALYCGAEVDFVDIDPHTYNLSAERLEEKLIASAKAGRLPKVVIPVHLAGQSCDMAAIHALSNKYGFSIIEDASHAIGARYRNEPVGNCRYSDIAIFSFHPVKIITTAEGGMALTNDVALAKRMQLLRSHGITREEEQMTKPSEGGWYYQQIDLGYNYRMNDIQAALGLSQINRLDQFVKTRHEIATTYKELLSSLPIILPKQNPDNYSAFHLYIVSLKLDMLSKSHKEIFEYLRSEGIGVNLHYIPVYLQPYYLELGFKKGYCPEAERYYARAISLPIYPGLTGSQQQRVIDVLVKGVEN